MLFQTSESTNNTKESGKNSGYRRGDISAPVIYMKITFWSEKSDYFFMNGLRELTNKSVNYTINPIV